MKKRPYSEFFWSLFSGNRTEYDPKNSEYRHISHSVYEGETFKSEQLLSFGGSFGKAKDTVHCLLPRIRLFSEHKSKQDADDGRI